MGQEFSFKGAVKSILGMKVVANMGMVKTDVRDRPTEKVNIRQAFAMDAEGRPVQHTS